MSPRPHPDGKPCDCPTCRLTTAAEDVGQRLEDIEGALRFLISDVVAATLTRRFRNRNRDLYEAIDRAMQILHP